MHRNISLNIAATYTLLFNASLLVDEGPGYAVGYDKIFNTTGDSSLCFRAYYLGKYQLFSKPAGKFLEVLKEIL